VELDLKRNDEEGAVASAKRGFEQTKTRKTHELRNRIKRKERTAKPESD